MARAFHLESRHRQANQWGRHFCLPAQRQTEMSALLKLSATLRKSALVWGIIVGVMLVLAGCGSTDPVARYGGIQNAVHDLLALRGVPQTVLVATDIGLYRTTNQGQIWQESAGGSGQPMDGLAILKLAQSPVDPQRMYALAKPRTGDAGAARGQPGIYTSDDAGSTWSLAAPLSALPGQAPFTIGAGSASAGQIFTFLSYQGTYALYESDDYGGHWRQLPPLPDSSPQGVTGVAGDPHGLYLWSATHGFYRSADDGQTWIPAAGIQVGIYSVAVLGDWVYACGDDGLYLSQDGGAHFSLVYWKNVFISVVAVPDYPQHAYGLAGNGLLGNLRAGTKVMLTDDGGESWQQLPSQTTFIDRHYGVSNTVPGEFGITYPGALAVDPADPDVVYVSFSYPIGVDVSTNDGKSWQAVIP